MTDPTRIGTEPVTDRPKRVGFSLRASVAASCNMACQYCPRYTSMEDYTPDRHRGRGITHERYLLILTGLLSTLRFTSVSFTGGEPTMNPHLPEIAAAARPLVDRLELNTNGLLLTSRRWSMLAPYFDRVKLSLDTLDPDLFKRLTEAPGRNPIGKVFKAIDLVTASGTELAINCVVSHDTLPTLQPLLDFTTRHGLRLHLLDYYFTEERRQNWQKQFIPIEGLMPGLRQRYGPSTAEPIFGCGFHRYDVPAHAGDPAAVVRVKTSYSGTMRAPRCATCTHYCQEGMYGLKLSTDGWVTTCPSTDEADGTLLEPGMTPTQIGDRLAGILSDLENTSHEPDSMLTLIAQQRLDVAADQQAALAAEAIGALP